MIDAENEIFSAISTKVRAQYPEIFMASEYVRVPSSFPFVSLVEVDNAAFRNSLTTAGNDNHAAVTYELNVYSNRAKEKKAECKEIIALIDDLLMELNFSRMMLEPIPNQDDATIYRMLGRYRAVISKNNVIFRR